MSIDNKFMENEMLNRLECSCDANKEYNDNFTSGETMYFNLNGKEVKTNYLTKKTLNKMANRIANNNSSVNSATGEGIDATITPYAVDVGLLKSQKVQYLPKKIEFKEVAGRLKLKPQEECAEVEINDYITERKPAGNVNRFATKVRGWDRTAQNIDLSDVIIEDADNDIVKNKMRAELPQRKAQLVDVKRISSYISRNTLQESIAESYDNSFLPEELKTKVLLLDSLNAIIKKAELAKFKFLYSDWLNNIGLSNIYANSSDAPSVSSGVIAELYGTGATSDADKGLFYFGNGTYHRVSFSQMSFQDFFVALDNLRKYYNNNSYVSETMYEDKYIYLDIQTINEMKSQTYITTLSNGTGEFYSAYKGMNKLEVLVNYLADSGIKINIVPLVDGYKGGTQGNFYEPFKQTIKYINGEDSEVQANTKRIMVIADKSWFNYTNVTEIGILKEANIVKSDATDLSNYVKTSPIDLQAFLLGSFSKVYTPTFKSFSDTYNMGMKFELQN